MFVSENTDHQLTHKHFVLSPLAQYQAVVAQPLVYIIADEVLRIQGNSTTVIQLMPFVSQNMQSINC